MISSPGRVLAERHAGGEVDAHLDGLAAGRAKIVPLQIGPRDAALLRLCAKRRQHGSATSAAIVMIFTLLLISNSIGVEDFIEPAPNRLCRLARALGRLIPAAARRLVP